MGLGLGIFPLAVGAVPSCAVGARHRDAHHPGGDRRGGY